MSERHREDDAHDEPLLTPIAWTIEDTASLFEAALSGIGIPFALYDIERRSVRCNREYLALFELSEADLDGRGVQAAEAAGRRLTENADEVPPFWASRPDRESRDLLHFRDGRVFERIVVPYCHSGRLLGKAASYRDITAKVASERELASSRAMLERAQEVAHIGSWVRDHTSGALQWTAESHRIFGVSSQAFPSTAESFLAFVHPDDRPMVQEAIAGLAEGRGYDVEHRLIRPNGEVVWVHQRAHIERDEASGRLLRTVGTIQDVTSRRRLEEQLRQAQKLEALGRLAGGVAHDLNNALTSIVGYTELAMAGLTADHPAAPDVLEIRRAAERAEAVTRQLLSFSRKQPLQARVFSLAETLASLSRMLRKFLIPHAELVIDVARDVEPICGDPGQIEQAIVNLAVNAKDAMPDGGSITIRLDMTQVDATNDSIHDSVPPGRYVELAMTDTGTGMAPDVLAHVFEPFFTTKDVGKGTGLGLAMVYGTVKQINGYVAVESEPGVGTTFRLYFPPAAPSPKGTTPPRAPIDHPSDRSPVIIVAEDETPVRNLVQLALANRGYRVLVAGSGQQALGLLEQEPYVDLLLTDANMPGMSGIDLVRHAVQRRRELRVMVMSGFTEDLPRLGDLGTEIDLLAKPFTPRELRERVDRLFGR